MNISVNLFKLFCIRQFDQIHEGGWPVFLHKISGIIVLSKEFIVYLMLAPVVVFVRLIRPLIWIRFGSIRSNIIGHFVFDTEYYLCEREIRKAGTKDFFYYESTKISNKQWALMVRCEMCVHPIIRYFDRLNRMLPGGSAHNIPSASDISGSRDIEGLLANRNPHFTFTESENAKAKEFCSAIGMNQDEKFVCLLVRDSAYKSKFQNKKNHDWSYHKYRDSDIESYAEAAMALAKRGRWVFRMGKAVSKPFNVDHPKIIDYALTPYRNDFLDIWLMANCAFCISTGSGLDEVAGVFKRPMAYVNFLPLTHFVSYRCGITMPKRLEWIDSGNELSIAEYFRHGYLTVLEYEKAGIKIKDLSSLEIKNTVLELNKKIEENWIESHKEKNAQQYLIDLIREMPNSEGLHGQLHPQAWLSMQFLEEQVNH